MTGVIKMANNDMRLLARGSGVAFWKIARALGISEPTMTRRMRTELPEAEKEKIRSTIAELREVQTQ
jgi:hypothetical protein